MNLADALFDREPDSTLILRDGIVAAVSPLTVTVPPSTVASPAACLGEYAPVVGEFVQVLVQGANRLVLGKTGTAARGHVRRVATQSATGGGVTNISFDTVALDIGAGAATGTTPLTLPPGWWVLQLIVSYSSAMAAGSYAQLGVAGDFGWVQPLGGGASLRSEICRMHPVFGGTLAVTARVFNNGATLNITGAELYAVRAA